MDHLYVIDGNSSGGNGSGGNGSGEPQLELPKTSGETAMESERGSEPEQELEPIAAAPVEEPKAPAVVPEEAAEVGNDDVGNNAEEGGGEEEDKAGGALCDDGKGEEGVGVDENGGAGLGPITEEVFEPVEDAGGEQVAAEKLEEITGDQVGEGYKKPFVFDSRYDDGDDSGSEEEQAAFMRELETFHKEKSLEFKPPKFYGEGLNCLKLWRAVTRLGGYDQVTSCKLWRQVGESFKPPKTCTTVSWSFRCFYEKALLEYEKHKIRTGELQFALPTLVETMPPENQLGSNQASGRARRDAAARAMQGWHSQRLLGNGEVGDPIIKDRSPASLLKRDKSHKSNGMFKRKKASLEHYPKVSRARTDDTQTLSMVVDVGPPADWVKINVRTTKDCFEVYALVPGLLREEVHVQSDPAGRLVISGDPEQPDNPWGVTPFKKVVTLPSRIDPHQTSAVVTLHGQLFVRAPFEQTEVQAI